MTNRTKQFATTIPFIRKNTATMAKIIAGETLTFKIDGQTITAKVEDGSKSEYILAKVESSSSPDYIKGQVYEFDRNALSGNEVSG